MSNPSGLWLQTTNSCWLIYHRKKKNRLTASEIGLSVSPWPLCGAWVVNCGEGNQVVSKHLWKTCTLASKDRIRIGGLGFQSSIVTNLPSMVKHWLIYSHHSRFWPLLGSRMFKDHISAMFQHEVWRTILQPRQTQWRSKSQCLRVSSRCGLSSRVNLWDMATKPGLHRTLATLGSVVWFKFAACLASSSSKVVLLSWCQPVYHSDLHVVPSVIIIIIIFEYMWYVNGINPSDQLQVVNTFGHHFSKGTNVKAHHAWVVLVATSGCQRSWHRCTVGEAPMEPSHAT